MIQSVKIKIVQKNRNWKILEYLTSDERVDYVIRQADYYGYSGDRVKGLIFCSRVNEAKRAVTKNE